MVIDYKCLNCNASIKFNPKLNKFKCEYCHSEFTIDEIKNYKFSQDKNQLHYEFDKMQDMEGYLCSNCGAEIISLDNIASTSCLYCKSSTIIKNRLTGIYKPDSIITFKYTKDDAVLAFKNICKGRPLLPKNFNDLKNIEEMEGLYVPFWLYDCTNKTNLEAKCTKVSTWMDSRYIYTKTSYYDVIRGGSLHFESVPNDAATRFSDIIMNAIEPFNYKDLEEFNTSYLAGFLSEKYDVSKDKAYLNAKERIEEDSKNYLKNQIHGYQSINVKSNTNDIKINQTKYVLLPVWVLNIKYKDKIYHFAMNGQTGKLVGEIPVDTKKLVIISVIVFILSLMLILGIFLLQGYRW